MIWDTEEWPPYFFFFNIFNCLSPRNELNAYTKVLCLQYSLVYSSGPPPSLPLLYSHPTPYILSVIRTSAACRQVLQPSSTDGIVWSGPMEVLKPSLLLPQHPSACGSCSWQWQWHRTQDHAWSWGLQLWAFDNC